MTKGELKRLLTIMEGAEKEMGLLEGGAAPVDQVLTKVRGDLSEFNMLANEFGVRGLAGVALKLGKYAERTNLGPEELTALTFAIGGLKSGIREATSEAIRSAIVEALEMIGIEPLEVSVPQGSEKHRTSKPKEGSWNVESMSRAPLKASPAPEPVPEAPPAEIEKPSPVQAESPKASEEELSRMESVASKLGGKLVPSKDSPGSFILELPPEGVQRVEYLVSPFDAADQLTKKLASDTRVEKILKTVKDFMASFAEGNILEAQHVLEDLAKVQGDGELYNEIGGIARELHNSLGNLAATVDPGLRELIEDKIPDSGNRLEHILKLTEDAASITLDHAESIQEGLRRDLEKVSMMERRLSLLKPVGDAAHGHMMDNAATIKELRESLTNHSEEIGIILTSQSYQDLTGQIVLKIVNFQKEIEGKLVGLVKTFGMAGSHDGKAKKDELYGPAHEKVAGAVHSQDEIDAMLAEFGF